MADIEWLTKDLRVSDEPLFRRLRELLSARGVDPAGAWLVELFPDDTAFQFGLLVTADRRVFQFGYDYLHRGVGEGELREWVDLTHGWHLTPYREDVENGFCYLDQAT
jgi:hypothetical protein